MAGEAAAAQEEFTQDSFLGMSDEDFAAQGDDFPLEPVAADSEEDVQDVQDETEITHDEDVSEQGFENTPDATDELDDTEDDATADEEDDIDETDAEASDDETEADDDDSEGDEETTDESNDVDFKAFHEKITGPFKANGKTMQVDNVEDAVRLMQMGANYNRKMAAMKPGLKVLKMLEKSELLDESKLNFLIDLNERNPDAIKQLLRDSKIDPMELNLEESVDYTAANRSVNDNEIELDTVIESIRDTDAYTRTIEVVTDQWDGASKQIVAETPQLLTVINDHVESGIYDLISTEVDKERMLGRLEGVSDIEAYRRMGDALKERGDFDHLGEEPSNSSNTAPAPKPTAKADDARRRQRRQAARPSKPAAPTSNSQDFNPLALSDEEFMEQHDPRLL